MATNSVMTCWDSSKPGNEETSTNPHITLNRYSHCTNKRIAKRCKMIHRMTKSYST